MDTYPSEAQLLAALDEHDSLVRQCGSGQLTFADFAARYGSFYWAFSLDGHESDPAGTVILGAYANRIAPHQAIAEEVLSKVCSDADALLEAYQLAGRFGSEEAVRRIRVIAERIPGGMS